MNFNAMSGAEVKEFILTKLRDLMDESGDFKAHLTYPWFYFDFNLKITNLAGALDNPMPAKEVAIEGSGFAGERSEGVATETSVFQGGGEVAVPDKARVETGQEIHVEEVSDTGIKVDRPKKVPAKKVTPWEEKEE